MRVRVIVSSLVLALTSPVFITNSQPATAACGFINGVWSHELAMTPQCVEENAATAERLRIENAATEAAKRIQDQLDVEARARENAEKDYIANGSRPCTLYPASITPECEAENMRFQTERQAAEKAAMEQKVIDDAKANFERDYIANGSRPCTLYPASITPECVAENLLDAAKKTAALQAKQVQDQKDAEARALKQAKDDYIRNGSRPCSIYPASITPECAVENLKFEEIKKVETQALAAARAESSKSLITTQDENGSLLVISSIPKGVDLLTTKVRLLNNKGKVVDTGVIRYESNGKPYFVFDNFIGKGNYKIQLTVPKKKAATIAIKL
jgi:23S rRNA pseudoU1915 N3-methylase RlmH